MTLTSLRTIAMSGVLTIVVKRKCGESAMVRMCWNPQN